MQLNSTRRLQFFHNLAMLYKLHYILNNGIKQVLYACLAMQLVVGAENSYRKSNSHPMRQGHLAHLTLDLPMKNILHYTHCPCNLY